MTTETQQVGSKFFDEVFQNIRKAAETNLKLQQDILGQWPSFWSMPSTQSPWADRVHDFQKRWGETVSDLARKHRAVLDRQYQAINESLDAALRVGEATNVEEYRRRSEQLCRKTIDCLREVSESQLHEFQEAVTKWAELATSAGK